MHPLIVSVGLALLAACSSTDPGGRTCSYNGHAYQSGDVFPFGDSCNSCTCTDGQVACSKLACADAGVGVDANPASCGASGGCPGGPVCGTVCCAIGERCDNGACRCGAQAACTTGDSCAAAGPVGGDTCGSICCGVSGPCPL